MKITWAAAQTRHAPSKGTEHWASERTPWRGRGGDYYGTGIGAVESRAVVPLDCALLRVRAANHPMESLEAVE